jgi:hypothetical protein
VRCGILAIILIYVVLDDLVNLKNLLIGVCDFRDGDQIVNDESLI